MSVPDKLLAHMPAKLRFQEAAALPLVCLTAYQVGYPLCCLQHPTLAQHPAMPNCSADAGISIGSDPTIAVRAHLCFKNWMCLRMLGTSFTPSLHPATTRGTCCRRHSSPASWPRGSASSFTPALAASAPPPCRSPRPGACTSPPRPPPATSSSFGYVSGLRHPTRASLHPRIIEARLHLVPDLRSKHCLNGQTAQLFPS